MRIVFTKGRFDHTRRLPAGAALLVALALVAGACSAGSDSTKRDFQDLPTETGHARDGGKVVVAQTPGLTPSTIFPYAPPAQGTTIAPGVMWRALYHPSGDPKQEVDVANSLADLPTFSADRRTATIRLHDYSWADGKPVVASDVVFTLDLLKGALAKSPANWGFYTPGQFPDGVTAEATDAKTVVLHLKTAYNTSYLVAILTELFVLPSHAWNIASPGGPHLDYTQPANAQAIYAYLSKQSSDQASFSTNPLWKVIDGPYQLKSFDPVTGSFVLTVNKAYSGPTTPRLTEVDFKAFTSTAAIFNQYKAGTVTVGRLDSTYISQIGSLESKGYQVYGAPSPGRSDPMLINFANTTNNFDKVIAQEYVREALQRVIDQPGYIKSRGIYDGAAVQNYSPVGQGTAYPPSFGSTAPYPYDPVAAKKLLADHGWKVVPNGSTTCQAPGTGPNQCGAGIPRGQTISFTVVSANTPAYVGARDVAFQSAAKQLGIKVTTVTKSLNYMYANLGNSYAPANKNKWGMQDAGASVNLGGYPTSNGLFNTTGSFNLGSYSSPDADRLIEQSTFGANPKALSAEATYLGKDLPGLFFPTPDTLLVWKKTLSGPPASFRLLLNYWYTPELWYLTK
jgi:peptide/nickel transport system substrate-binding protein